MTSTVEIDQAKLEAFTNQVFGDLSACYGGVMASLGVRLGLYEALAGAGPLTAEELADRTDCAERYVREWLNSQVAAGYLDYHPDTGTYEMSPEQAAVLVDRASPALMAPAFHVVASLWHGEDRAIEAFRTGAGVPWGDHHERLFCGVAAFFRAGYSASLVPDWLPALDGVVERLEAGATVADVGCGHGYSTALMAEAFPNSKFVGLDVHPGSIAAAREAAEEAGVADRVTFEVATAEEYEAPNGGFDLICFFDALHDMGDPVAAARHAGRMLADGGTVMLVEPNAADSVEGNIGPIGRLYYGASTMLCTAHAISEGGEALGAQAGEARLAQVFAEAGFGHWRRAAETPFNLILEARA
jgi:SAM-dependent methyltransferase